MGITFVNISYVLGSLTCAAPSGCQPGDVLVAHIFAQSAAISPPAGWTLIANPAYLEAYYWRVWQTGDTNWTWTSDGGGDRAVSVVAYRGVNNTTPINAYLLIPSHVTFPPVISSITTTVPGCMIDFCLSAIYWVNHFSLPILNGNAMTPALDSGYGEPTIYAAYKLQDSAGATGDASASTANNYTSNFGILIALSPAPPSGGLLIHPGMEGGLNRPALNGGLNG